MATSSHETEFYVVFDAEVYARGIAPYVRKVRSRRVTQKKPDLAGGEIALKFKVSIPDNAFLRLIPDIEIIVPDGFWTSVPITVNVEQPPEEAP